MATLRFSLYSTHRNILEKLNILEVIHKCTKVNSAIHIGGLIHMIWIEENHEVNQDLSYKLFVWWSMLCICSVPKYESSSNVSIFLQTFALIGVMLVSGAGVEDDIFNVLLYCLCLFTNIHSSNSWAWNVKYFLCSVMNQVIKCNA